MASTSSAYPRLALDRKSLLRLALKPASETRIYTHTEIYPFYRMQEYMKISEKIFATPYTIEVFFIYFCRLNGGVSSIFSCELSGFYHAITFRRKSYRCHNDAKRMMFIKICCGSGAKNLNDIDMTGHYIL